jgi:alcohol-forming fatty acyl-CoA reductase
MERNVVYDFYKDSTILITGGTGFLGKVLVEKLLRCFQVKKIFLLVRRKNDENPEERLKKYSKESVKSKIAHKFT